MAIDPKDLRVGDLIVAHLELVVSQIDLSDSDYPIEAMLTDGLPIMISAEAIVEKLLPDQVKAGCHVRKRSDPYGLFRVKTIVGDQAWISDVSNNKDGIAELDDLFFVPSPAEDE